MGFTGFFEHPAITFLHQVVLVIEQEIGYFKNLTQEIAFSGRQDKGYRRIPPKTHLLSDRAQALRFAT